MVLTYFNTNLIVSDNKRIRLINSHLTLITNIKTTQYKFHHKKDGWFHHKICGTNFILLSGSGPIYFFCGRHVQSVNSMSVHILCEQHERSYSVWTAWAFIFCVNSMSVHILCEQQERSYSVWTARAFIFCVNSMSVHILCEQHERSYSVWTAWAFIFCVNSMSVHILCEQHERSYSVWTAWAFIFCVNSMSVHILCEQHERSYSVWTAWAFIFCVNSMSVHILRCEKGTGPISRKRSRKSGSRSDKGFSWSSLTKSTKITLPVLVETARPGLWRGNHAKQLAWIVTL